jgi:subfamily B ATP-binding cassette protein MsbA
MSGRQSLDAAVRDDAGSARAQMSLLRRLWGDHVRGHLPALIVALVFMTLEGASLGAFAWLVRPLFDELFTQGSMDGVLWVASLIAALFVIRSLSGFVQRLIVVNVGLRVSNALQGRMVNHMLGLDQRFFHDNAPGALIERVRGDTLALQKLASSTLIAAGRDTVTLLSLIVVMLATDWVWTLTALIGIPLLVVPLIWCNPTSAAPRSRAGRPPRASPRGSMRSFTASRRSSSTGSNGPRTNASTGI